MSKESIVWDLIRAWINYRGGFVPTPNYCQLATDLYQARNPGFNNSPPLSHWPADLISSDAEVMAATEHYFLSRCWVGTGVQPAWQLRALTSIYNFGKDLGITPQHNPNNPVSPPSALQESFQEYGTAAGEADLALSGASGPIVSMPPSY